MNSDVFVEKRIVRSFPRMVSAGHILHSPQCSFFHIRRIGNRECRWENLVEDGGNVDLSVRADVVHIAMLSNNNHIF